MTRTSRQNEYDVVVIGGGSAGYAAARTAAQHKLKTLVVEGAAKLGGLCILRGCMPSKALLYAAEVRHVAGEGATWGLAGHKPAFDFRKVMARKDAVIADFAEFRSRQLSDGRFGLVRESAQFVNAHTVQLSNGTSISADSFVIATGSRVADPPLPQLDEIGFLTSDDVLRLASPPRSLIVLGGGSIALEFAQFFSRFDTEVTVIQRSPQILRDFDPDDAQALSDAIRAEGMALHTGTTLRGARREGSLKVVEFEKDGQRLECRAEEVLMALGRSPNTEALGLDRVGVETENGRIITTPTQATTTPNIYAAGDCCGPYEIVHLAVQQGEIAAHNLAGTGKRREMDYRLLINVVFTDPQIASVGLTEKQARKDHVDFVAASYPFNDHGKSIIMNVRHGHVKLLANPVTGEILGGSCVGPSGGELIHEIVVAMHKRMTVHELASLPHYHPTLAEIWTYPAEELADRIPS